MSDRDIPMDGVNGGTPDGQPFGGGDASGGGGSSWGQPGRLGPAGPPQHAALGEAELEVEEESKKRKGTIWLILAILLIVAGLVVAFISFQDRGVATGGSTDMHGNVIVPDDPQITDPSFQASANAIEGDVTGGFVVPAVDLDCPLGSVNAVEGILNPPGFTGAYVVRNMGVSLDVADTGTVFVITHSVHGGGVAPGNYLIDVTNGTTTLHAGDLIHVGDRTYAYTEVHIVKKEDLGAHPEFFADVPGRLVLITCLQTPQQGKSYDNIVMYAKLVS